MIEILRPELKIGDGYDTISLCHVRSEAAAVSAANQMVLNWLKSAFRSATGLYIIRPTDARIKFKNCSLFIADLAASDAAALGPRVHSSRIAVFFTFLNSHSFSIGGVDNYQLVGDSIVSALQDQKIAEDYVKKNLMIGRFERERDFKFAWHFVVPLERTGHISSGDYTDPMVLAVPSNAALTSNPPPNLLRGIARGLAIRQSGSSKDYLHAREIRALGKSDPMAEITVERRLSIPARNATWDSFSEAAKTAFDTQNLLTVYDLPNSAVKTLKLLTQRDALIEGYATKQLELERHLSANRSGGLALLSGEAGTGKTIFALRAALKACTTDASRIAYITWNRALRADVAMLAFSGNKDIERITAFGIEEVIKKLAVWTNGAIEDNDQNGVEKIQNALALWDDRKLEYARDLVRLHRALTSGGTGVATAAASESFAFDLVVVDEAQDLLDEEIEILARVFPKSHFIVVHGATQVLRRRKALYKSHIKRVFAHAPHHEDFLKRQWRMRAVQTEAYKHILSTVQTQPEPGDLGPQTLLSGLDEAPPGGKIWILDCESTDAALSFALSRVVALGEKYHPRDSLFIEENYTEGRFKNTLSLLRPEPSTLSGSICLNNGLHGLPVYDYERSMPKDAVRVLGYLQARGCEGAVVACLNLSSFLCNHMDKISHLTVPQQVNQLRQFLLVPFSRAFEDLVIHFDSRRELYPELVCLIEEIYNQVGDSEWITGDKLVAERANSMLGMVNCI